MAKAVVPVNTCQSTPLRYLRDNMADDINLYTL